MTITARGQVQIQQVASPGVTVVLNPARRVAPDRESELYGRDINGNLYPRDVGNTDITSVEIEFYIMSLTQENMNNLYDLFHNREQVTVTDGTTLGGDDKTSDAYYKTYTGYIDKMPPESESPLKQDSGPYRMRILVDATTRLAMP